MTHWKLTLTYDGTPYHGWQVQPGLPTVQGTLADAIHRSIGERVLPQGSGRTDTGVHALAQVASFSLEAPIPASRLQNALNRCLPPSIRVLSAEPVPPTFHARHSALAKTYEYRIFPLKPVILSEAPERAPGAPNEVQPKDPEAALSAASDWRSLPAGSEPDLICPPILAPFVWPCPWPLDLDALNAASAHVLGAHDFTSFAAADPDLATRTAPQESAISTGGGVAAAVERPPHLSLQAAQPPIRTITHSAWHRAGPLFIYRVTANGFLHHMVRNLVGTFVQCGSHRRSPESIPALLAARNRSAAGPTAPPHGLFLVSVDYPGPQPLFPAL